MNINDDYDHPSDSRVEYITENVIFIPTSEDILKSDEYEKLEDLFNSVLMNACACSSNDQCTTVVPCSHGGNYKILKDTSNQDRDGKMNLILNSNRLCKDLIYECSEICKCNPGACTNRLVQFGPCKHLEIIDSSHLHGQKGLKTIKFIPMGAFVCEYAGEVLTRTEAKRREVLNKSQENEQMNYIMCLNELAQNMLDRTEFRQTFVDPTHRGNIGRYLNHSCKPNCELFSVRVDCPVPKIGIFAKRDIEAFEELTFHYGGGMATKSTAEAEGRIVCKCGAMSCMQFLPNINF